MLIGLLMLFLPIAIYLATFPVARKLNPRLCKLYRIIGGIIVLAGGATSVYFAAYTGDQGGIAAFYFQVSVILVYLSFSILLVTTNWLFRERDGRETEN